jgi:hypothetical protein
MHDHVAVLDQNAKQYEGAMIIALFWIWQFRKMPAKN